MNDSGDGWMTTMRSISRSGIVVLAAFWRALCNEGVRLGAVDPVVV